MSTVKKWRTQYNTEKPQIEKKFGPSMTVPDQAMSMREIMSRFARGLPISGERVPIYQGEEEFPGMDWERLDLSERQELLESAKENTQQLREKLNRNPKVLETVPTKAQSGEAESTGSIP